MDKTQHMALKYADDKLVAYADAAIHKPWNEFRDMVADTYMAGATDALGRQWRKAAFEKPDKGQNVLVCYKWYDKRSCRWLTGMAVARYSGDGEFELNNVIYWMPIPHIIAPGGNIIEP